MKSLVLWCRWHDARLRLQGRDGEAVWGELAFNDRTERFRYELGARRLTIGAGEGQRAVQLDDMGVESD
ncbi:MAG: hypothetical protein GX579_01405 [Chloroflexi bacterium]|nr:hypothetical protein [Chloroflexota bacterium]